MSKFRKSLFGFCGAGLLLVVLACGAGKQSPKRQEKVVPDIQTQDPVWRPKVDALVKTLESKRKEYHIPGMAIAVVHGDDILLAKGFGMADLENQIPATSRTVFAIGSATKAFTSTLIGMLVDDGKMNWDDPIEKYLPYMKLQPRSEKENAKVTLRDMLSHRSGFTRMGILWASGESSREAILSDASSAEPWEGFREGFYYNNVLYLGAGMASAQAAGSDWDQLLASRLLRPLEMNASHSSYAKAQADSNFSAGYRWNTETESYERQPMRNIDNIAPAGAINANVLDMTHWLRFQLDHGEFKGRRLISKDSLAETRTPQVDIVEGTTQYGLGWFLQQWQDQPVVQHGGNIDGFAAMVAFAPESDLGFVLLTNTSSSPLQQLSVNLVLDHLLSETKSVAATGTGPSAEANYQPYVGDYLADFGPFDNATLKVLIQNGKLAVDVPGQTVYALHPENEEGKWVFELTDTIAVSFEKDDAGKVTLMRLHQSGLDFELPRKGIPIEPEIDPAEFTKFLGNYYSERHKLEVSVFVKNHRLTLKMGNQPLDFELHLPDEEGRRRFRIREDSHVVFNTDESGAVVSVSRYRDGALKEVMKRMETVALPSLEDIDELRGNRARRKAIESLGVFRLTGKVRFVHAGVRGKADFFAKGADHYLLHLALGKYGEVKTFASPDRAATSSSHSPFEEYSGKYLDQVRKGHFGIAFLNWRDLYDTVEVLGVGSLEEKKVYLIKLGGGQAYPTTLYLDPETGDVLKQDSKIYHPTIGTMETTTFYGDYREINGLRVPFEIRSKNLQVGELVYRFEALESNLDMNVNDFAVEKP